MKILVLTSASNLLGGALTIALHERGINVEFVFLSFRDTRWRSIRGVLKGIRRDGPGFYVLKIGDLLGLRWRTLRRMCGGAIQPLYPVEVSDAFGIPVTELDDCNCATAVALFREKRPDFIVTAGFGQILKKAVLSVPCLDALNVHPSCLPDHPGSNPYRDVLRFNARMTGVTLHRLTRQVDGGEILRQARYPVPPHSSQRMLRALAARHAAELVCQYIMKTGPHPDDSGRA